MNEQKANDKLFQFPILAAGCICFGLVFVVEKLGGVFSIGIAFSGISSGTLLGLFTMGMISERFNTKGALWGSITSIVVVSVMVIGAQINIFAGKLRYETLPMSIEQCNVDTVLDGFT